MVPNVITVMVFVRVNLASEINIVESDVIKDILDRIALKNVYVKIMPIVTG